MTGLLIAILLQSAAVMPTRAALENPAIANPVPKQLQKDYDKLWKRFVLSKDAKEDTKVSTEFDKLLKKNPDFVPGLLTQAYMDLYAGRQAAAERRFENILAKHPTDKVALYYLSEFAYDRNEYARASVLFRRLKAVDNSHSDVDTKSQRAFLLAMQGLMQEAAAAAQGGRTSDADRLYKQAVELAPDDIDLHRQLATMLGRTPTVVAVSGNDTSDPQRQREAVELQDLGRWGTQIERLREIRATEALTREQFAGLLARYFPQLLEFRQTPQIMTDLPNSWASPAIETVVGVGLLDPTVNHTFQPSRTVSRGEFAQAIARLVRMLGVSQGDAPPIAAPDLVPGSALYRELQLVLGYGLLSLDNAGNVNVSAPIRGEEAVNTAEKLLRLLQQKPA